MSEVKTFSTTFCGRPLRVEIGKYAFLANGACMVFYAVAATMTAVSP